MERNDSTPSAGEAPNAEASKSRGGGGRKRLASGLALLAAFACFTFVGIQGVTADEIPTPSSSPIDGDVPDGEPARATTVVVGTGSCSSLYTVADALHEPDGNEGSEFDDSILNSGPGNTYSSFGRVEWDDVSRLIFSYAKVAATQNGGSIIGNHTAATATNSADSWKLATTGTCTTCPPHNGYAEYFLVCKSFDELEADWAMTANLNTPFSPPGTGRVHSKSQMTDHNEVQHPVEQLYRDNLYLGLEFKVDEDNQPIPVTDEDSVSKPKTSRRMYVLEIGQSKTLVAHGFYESEIEASSTGGEVSLSSESETSATFVSQLWLVPYCGYDAENQTGVSQPGGVSNYALWLRAETYSSSPSSSVGGQSIDEKCISLSPCAAESAGIPGGSLPTESDSRALTGERLNPDGGSTWATGTETASVFSDGSLLLETELRSASGAFPLICKKCYVVYDNCGKQVYSCCRTTTIAEEGAPAEQSTEGADCPLLPAKPVPCALD